MTLLLVDSEKHKSGLSDMLAAFPPPAHPAPSTTRRSFRDSIRQQVQSWPLPLNLNRSTNSMQESMPGFGPSRAQSNEKPGRRCCGLPLWGFIVVLIVVLLLIAAAIVIPLEFLVIRKQNASSAAQAALQQCQSQLTCANGGTHVVNQGVCSCLCTNGFTGSDCTVPGTTGCTTISLAGNNAPKNVTVGNAIPRLLQQAQTNFSIPLSDTEILAKLNAGGLSCSAENALVTFDGKAVREGSALSVVSDSSGPVNVANVINGVILTTVTIMVGGRTTITIPFVAPPTQSAGVQDGGGNGVTTSIAASSAFSTTITLRRPTSTTSAPSYPASDIPTSTSTVTTTMTMSSGEPLPTGTFAVTEEVLDFARVAVLFILQKETLSNAEAAQTSLQKFFSSARPGSGTTVAAARNITIGNSNSVNLVDFLVSTGGSNPPVGGGSKSKLKARTILPQGRSRWTIRGTDRQPN